MPPTVGEIAVRSDLEVPKSSENTKKSPKSAEISKTQQLTPIGLHQDHSQMPEMDQMGKLMDVLLLQTVKQNIEPSLASANTADDEKSETERNESEFYKKYLNPKISRKDVFSIGIFIMMCNNSCK